MSARAGWIAVGAAIVVVLGLVAVFVFNTTLFEREPKTWTVQPGETLTLSADEVHPDDRYRCPGLTRIDFTPHAGTGYSDVHGFYVFTAEDGTVTASCQPSGNA